MSRLPEAIRRTLQPFGSRSDALPCLWRSCQETDIEFCFQKQLSKGGFQGHRELCFLWQWKLLNLWSPLVIGRKYRGT